jgi:hypothetical protein
VGDIDVWKNIARAYPKDKLSQTKLRPVFAKNVKYFRM